MGFIARKGRRDEKNFKTDINVRFIRLARLGVHGLQFGG